MWTTVVTFALESGETLLDGVGPFFSRFLAACLLAEARANLLLRLVRDVVVQSATATDERVLGRDTRASLAPFRRLRAGRPGGPAHAPLPASCGSCALLGAATYVFGQLTDLRSSPTDLCHIIETRARRPEAWNIVSALVENEEGRV
jgi:hypothetical protein